jgi:putative ATP-dependent endonuclease of the OLD family
MITKSVMVENFRCIKYEVLTCEHLTALVGPNGSGKSAFLKAIDLFYSTSPKLTAEDFYNADTGTSIQITVTFSDLDAAEKKQFSKYLQGDELSVVRVLSLEDGKQSDKYHGSTLQSPDFVAIRKAGSATAMKELYARLQDKEQYKTLPKWKNRDDSLAALTEWETANQSVCTRERDDGQFFGFKQVEQGYLGRSTRYLYIPAVREASEDASEGRGSPITELMDLVVRSLVQDRTDFKEFRESSERRYSEIFSPGNLKELGGLADDLTKNLKQYVPQSGVDLEWLPTSALDIPMPQALVKLVEDGYKTSVERAGHGLQRAFIMTLLQSLAVAQAKAEALPGASDGSATKVQPADTKVKMPNLILGIEEPELYQHPGRQRHLAKILMEISRGQIPGVAEHTQVLYCTHSPLFISLDRFNEVRLTRKVPGADGQPKKSQLTSRTLDEVADRLWRAEGMPTPKYTGETLEPRLAALFDQVSEAFFASVALLVEGDGDRAAVLGAALAQACDLESTGVSVIPCGGKSNVCTAAAISISFGIPTFCVWDSDENPEPSAGNCEKCGRALDKKGNPAENRRLLRLLGLPEEDWPEHVKETSACFKKNRETTFIGEIGEADFIRLLHEQMTRFGIPKESHALKNPRVVAEILKSASKAGKSSPSLNAIVKNARELSK